MKKKMPMFLLFVCSAVVLWISLHLFYNGALYVDEYGTSASAICGGDFWNYMDWARLALLGMMTVVSGIKLLQK